MRRVQKTFWPKKDLLLLTGTSQAGSTMTPLPNQSLDATLRSIEQEQIHQLLERAMTQRDGEDMSNNRNVSASDLLDEGRRFVLEVGEYHEGTGFRATVVFENHPVYFPIGEITNRPDALPVLWWHTDDRESAGNMAIGHSALVLGLSKKEHLTIVASSIAAQYRAEKVVVRYDTERGEFTIANGYGAELNLEEDQAVEIYQSIAKILDLPHRESCTNCGQLMEEADTCFRCD